MPEPTRKLTSQELLKYSRKAVACLSLSLGLLIVAVIAGRVGELLVQICGLTSFGFLLLACYFVARRKGYWGGWATLGLFLCPGFFILTLLPDKHGDDPLIYQRKLEGKDDIRRLRRAGDAALLFSLLSVIIIAVAIPMYISHKRVACDKEAQMDLETLRAACERFENDPNNRGKKAPLSLENLLGSYYGWGGTSRKCGVRIFHDHDRKEISAVALNGSEPAGKGSRYIFRLNLAKETHEPPHKAERFQIEEYHAYTLGGKGRQASCFDDKGSLVDGCRR